jgi:hypothetical protein
MIYSNRNRKLIFSNNWLDGKPKIFRISNKGISLVGRRTKSRVKSIKTKIAFGYPYDCSHSGTMVDRVWYRSGEFSSKL